MRWQSPFYKLLDAFEPSREMHRRKPKLQTEVERLNNNTITGTKRCSDNNRKARGANEYPTAENRSTRHTRQTIEPGVNNQIPACGVRDWTNFNFDNSFIGKRVEIHGGWHNKDNRENFGLLILRTLLVERVVANGCSVFRFWSNGFT